MKQTHHHFLLVLNIFFSFYIQKLKASESPTQQSATPQHHETIDPYQEIIEQILIVLNELAIAIQNDHDSTKLQEEIESIVKQYRVGKF